MACIRRRRLGGARRELDHPGSSYTVAEVAARRRFADTSHFRRAYETPTDTHPDDRGPPDAAASLWQVRCRSG
ncbi:hypothetical protein AV521_37640 [Streptomyces sp. IMTB 2501]|nr:hypothetical protein AV521_37640 [Streptomyces sp. IMTB 2501]